MRPRLYRLCVKRSPLLIGGACLALFLVSCGAGSDATPPVDRPSPTSAPPLSAPTADSTSPALEPTAPSSEIASATPTPKPTPDPDGPEAESARTEARAALASVPGVGNVVAFVEEGNVAALMPLFARDDQPCGREPSRPEAVSPGRRQSCELAGVPERTRIPIIRMRDDDFPRRRGFALGQEWLASELEPLLVAMLADGSARLEHARVDRIHYATRDGEPFFEDRYVLGFSVPETDPGPMNALSRAKGEDGPVLRGLGLAVRALPAEQPVEVFALLSPYEEPTPGWGSWRHLPQPMPNFDLDIEEDHLTGVDTPPELLAELRSTAGAAAVLDSVEAGDTDALLVLMRLEEKVCFPDSVRHNFSRCVEKTGAAPDGSYRALPYDGGLQHDAWSVNTLRVYLNAAHSRGAPRLSLVAEMDDGERRLLLLVFDTLAVHTREFKDLWAGFLMSGYSVLVDPSAELPIVRFGARSTAALEWASARYPAYEVVFDAHRGDG